MPHHPAPSPPSILRLRECGLISPRNKFRTVLNVRGVAIRRELNDRDLKFDERVKARQEAYELLNWTEEAYQDGHPRSVIKQFEQEYENALDRVEEAHRRRQKRIEWLKSTRALIKKTIYGK